LQMLLHICRFAVAVDPQQQLYEQQEQQHSQLQFSSPCCVHLSTLAEQQMPGCTKHSAMLPFALLHCGAADVWYGLMCHIHLACKLPIIAMLLACCLPPPPARPFLGAPARARRWAPAPGVRVGV
jgi:hypothetical protein